MTVYGYARVSTIRPISRTQSRPRQKQNGGIAASVFYFGNQRYPSRPAACASRVYTRPVSEIR